MRSRARCEFDTLSPVPHAGQLGPQFPTCRGQAVPVFVLDQARRSKLAQTLGENAGRHVRHFRRQLAIRQSSVVHLPDQPQRPSPSEDVEQLVAGLP